MNDETKKIIRELKDSIKEHKKEKRSISAGMGMTWEEWDIFFEYFDNLQQEIKRLNIINELEKWLIERIDNVPETMAEVYEDKLILEKIKELKEYEKQKETQHLIKDKESFNYSMSDQVDY